LATTNVRWLIKGCKDVHIHLDLVYFEGKHLNCHWIFFSWPNYIIQKFPNLPSCDVTVKNV